MAEHDSLSACYRGLIAQDKTHNEAVEHCALRFGVPRDEVRVLVAAARLFDEAAAKRFDAEVVAEPLQTPLPDQTKHTPGCDEYNLRVGPGARCVCDIT